MAGFNNTFGAYNGFNTAPGPYTPTATTPIGTIQPTFPAQTQYSSTFTAPTIPTLSGRVIDSEAEVITPNEVPMNGGMSLFPTTNRSCVIAKFWDTDGNLRTVKYVPVDNPEATPEIQTNVIEMSVPQELLDKIDNLERLIKRNNNNHYKKNYNKKPYHKENQNGSGGEQ